MHMISASYSIVTERGNQISDRQFRFIPRGKVNGYPIIMAHQMSVDLGWHSTRTKAHPSTKSP
jgi:hypothetical protein